MPSLSHIIEDQQDKILETYLAKIKNLEERRVLEQFLPKEVSRDYKKGVKLFADLDLDQKLLMAKHLARIADIQSRVRNGINSRFVGDMADQDPQDAYSFRYVLTKFATNELSPEQVEKLIQKTPISNSITAHPTNSYSTKYTAMSMELEHIIAEEYSEEKKEKIAQQLGIMIAEDPTPDVRSAREGKKTQEEEVREAMIYMVNIYEQLPNAKRHMENVLEDLGYGDIKVGNFYKMGAWLAGDGDGNPEATAEALKLNIELFTEEIKRLYVLDLVSISKLNVDVSHIKLEDFKTPEAFIKVLEDLKKSSPEAKKKIEDLIYRVENFGFHYAKIDVRHDAGDINIALVEVLSALGEFKDENAKAQCLKELQNGQNVEQYAQYLSDKLSKEITSPGQILQIIQSKNPQTEELKTATRVFSRLQIVANNPAIAEKLIIAECKNQANALAAMFLLKASGNSINKKGSISIVTLSESAEDLIALPENIGALLENKTYRNHIIANGKLYYMIAKSDTQRRDGVGAGYAQELPPEQISKLFAKMAIKYPELKEVSLIPFNGGGHALQRGGGRIDEIPNVYAKAAIRGLYWSGNQDSEIQIQPPVLTTQGHQNGILFSSCNASNFLISYFSQSIYAKAKMAEFMAESEILDELENVNLFAFEARKNRELFFKKAQAVYVSEIATNDSPINVLFRKGPLAGVGLANVSSRPGKRGGKNDSAPQLIAQRAIGAEKMCAHSGTHLISWYSAKEGLEAVIQEKGTESASSMYNSDKATRDSFRAMAMSLFMTDFDVAWEMMVGSTRPETEEIKELAKEYQPPEFKNFENMDEGKRNKVTLAHIEISAIETAKLIFRIIAPVEKELSDLAPAELLTKLWPELAVEIGDREKKLKFSHLLEASLTNNLPEDQTMQNIIRNLNTACNGSEAPTAPTLSSTKGIVAGKGVVRGSRIDPKLAEILAIVGGLSPDRNPNGNNNPLALQSLKSSSRL
ncbi:MAG: phosphoenolpyruvate carboxylase [Rickettsiales bacterium]|jgi:phosphoenolpyruvate carboxylase